MLFICQANISAQALKVIEEKSEKSIADVLVFSEDKSFFEVTGEGQIVLPEMDGNQLILFQHPAYFNIELTYDEIKERDFIVKLRIESIGLDEITVSTNRLKENPRQISNTFERISAKEIAMSKASNSADLLEKSSQVYVQRSQAGGGSPVIRGMEANKVLLVVDGVKMNNAIYRGGHLQNVISIDPSILDNLEIVYGPGSLVYGSDALGGVMHFQTRNPKFSSSKKVLFEANTNVQYHTANNSRRLHFDLGIAQQKWSSLTSFTSSDFGTLKIGKQGTKDYPDWGYQDEYIVFWEAEGIDTILQNAQSHKIKNTWYSQWDLLQKFNFKLGDKKVLGINAQYSTSSNIARNDRLNDYSGGELKFAQWDYGPQKRGMLSMSFRDAKSNLFYDQSSVILATQIIEESRLKRRYQADWQSNQIESLDIWSLNLDARKALSLRNSFQYGFEWTRNDVESVAFEKNIFMEGEERQILSRYPNGENRMSSYGIYVKDKWILSEKLIWTNGLRYSLTQLDASYEQSDFIDLPVNEFSYSKSALNFGSGLRYNANSNNALSINLSSGFRAPNLDDVAKYFSPDDRILVVPNADIDPEYIYSADIGYELRGKNKSESNIDRNKNQEEKFRIGINLYGSFIQNLIRRSPFPVAGQDSIFFDSEMHALYANVNAENAVIYGASINASYSIAKGLELIQQLSYTKGIELGKNLPLGHIPPIYGQTGLAFKSTSWNINLNCRYNAAKKIENYSPYNEDKNSEATVEGTPAWATLNFSMNYQPRKKVGLHFGIENIFDQHYRPFSSGISAPGRNFILGLDLGI